MNDILLSKEEIAHVFSFFVGRQVIVNPAFVFNQEFLQRGISDTWFIKDVYKSSNRCRAEIISSGNAQTFNEEDKYFLIVRHISSMTKNEAEQLAYILNFINKGSEIINISCKLSDEKSINNIEVITKDSDFTFSPDNIMSKAYSSSRVVHWFAENGFDVPIFFNPTSYRNFKRPTELGVAIFSNQIEKTIEDMKTRLKEVCAINNLPVNLQSKNTMLKFNL